MKKYKIDDELDNQERVQAPVEKNSEKITIKEVLVLSRIQSKLQYTGQVSGKLYEWSGAGQAVPVLEEDVPELLSKRLGRKGCCGNNENIIFEIAQEA